MAGLRHEAFTRELRGAIFKVRNELGGGWSEEIYHQALVALLNERQIPTKSKPRRSIVYRGAELHTFEPDIIVWDKIILELKVLPYQKDFANMHYAQIIHYLKFFENDLGLLVNFAAPRVKIKRVLWDALPIDFSESYDHIRPYLTARDKKCLRLIRQMILTLAEQIGLGYPEKIYREMLAIEAAHNHIDCVCNVDLQAKWNGKIIGRQGINQILLQNDYLVHIRSMLDSPTAYDFISTKTYLKNLGLRLGLVINFGKKQLQIFGVTPN